MSRAGLQEMRATGKSFEGCAIAASGDGESRVSCPVHMPVAGKKSANCARTRSSRQTMRVIGGLARPEAGMPGSTRLAHTVLHNRTCLIDQMSTCLSIVAVGLVDLVDLFTHLCRRKEHVV